MKDAVIVAEGDALYREGPPLVSRAVTRRAGSDGEDGPAAAGT
jgi:hypothetical protein